MTPINKLKCLKLYKAYMNERPGTTAYAIVVQPNGYTYITTGSDGLRWIDNSSVTGWGCNALCYQIGRIGAIGTEEASKSILIL